ncbi:hypothetical protein CPB83DRAFT_868384 [Crepidotus variabilis]|uniref:Uncharacterized protein n=1 Tax=Crepidotus variabilis TaxID=179855 RepID=A0A9P6EL02_9AGAR|nr:hypothetical protein CPB83DRAFT_868384 [Crepidotus variabilis]
MVGLPKDPGYKAACDRLYAKLEQVGSQLQEESRSNRRGPFPVLNVGITHGKGTPHPVTLHSPLAKTPSKHVEVVEALLKDQDLVRIATFGSACFQMWAPDIFDYYKSKLDKLYARMPQLRRNFQKSVFPAAAINCGPNVWTYHHRDSMNCPFGFCAITALGRFDPKFGGHLILRGLKLVIEFPPGATILIPSAVVVHGNIPVQPGDVRASFTQYCPGGLLRFVDNHFMTEKKLKKANKTEYARLMAEKPLRWKMGLGLLSKFDDLVTRVE